MKLYCMRHGEAEPIPSGQKGRALTEKGVKEIEQMANYLSEQGVVIHHIMHSSKRRAQETAQILANTLQIQAVTECKSLLSPEADVDLLLEMIKTWHEDTLLVGHLPFLPKLVSALVVEEPTLFPIVNYPPGGIVCLEYYDAGRFVINFVLRPDML